MLKERIITQALAKNPSESSILEIDFLRAWACLCVVVIHVTANPLYFAEPGSLNHLILLVINQFTRFAVPAFVFITGFTLAWSHLIENKPFQYLPYLKRRFRQVLLPYLAWSSLYFIFLNWSADPRTAVVYAQELGLGILLGSTAYHLYFVVLILQFYLLAPLFLRLYRRFPYPLAFLGLGTLLQFALNIYNYYYAAPFQIPILDFFFQYLDRNCLLWVGYFLLGMGLAGVFPQVKNWLRQHGSWILLLPALVFWVALVGEFLSALQAGKAFFGVVSSVKPLILFYTLSVILALFWLQPKIKAPGIQSFFRQISQYSFGVYLAHPLLIWILERFLFANPQEIPLLGVGLLYGLSVFGSYALMAAFRQIIVLRSK